MLPVLLSWFLYTYMECCLWSLQQWLLLIGTLPLVITSDVSPLGNHSVRIVASSGAEDTVSYTISDTADSTGQY